MRAPWGRAHEALLFVRHFRDTGQLGRFSGHVLKFTGKKKKKREEGVGGGGWGGGGSGEELAVNQVSELLQLSEQCQDPTIRQDGFFCVK